ncbi:hypothetical protein CYLTODRAFT_485588 [Cylindrobasidium torrendii FP15055 ss-10]|uniref:Uncharacterized protein n=1 Tax=Cylindrobasidium torrendii FP15055 ss-10 TaxID=1314674 RepID=A0A0D7BSD0_9AGAR|nr:hypothetical protein CYLTODRAFT_485588 [Cylindrobasidium torrendii FP15055 ss-10]
MDAQFCGSSDAYLVDTPLKRKFASDVESILPADADDRSKPRRVNPLHLASRLGADLVREMEAHITPGAVMPSFAIRKDLQERYNVDRRHLYDYFHSRGLRVAKEERFNNLARSRQKKAQENDQLPEVEPLAKRQCINKRPPLYQLPSNIPQAPRHPSTGSKQPCRRPTAPQPHTSSSSQPSSTHQAASSTSSSGLVSAATDSATVKFVKPQSPVPRSASTFSFVDQTIDPRELVLSSKDFEPYDATKDPDGPYALTCSAALDSLLSIASSNDATPSLLSLPKSLNQEQERYSLYNLIHQSTLRAYESVGSYKSYMAERRNTYYRSLSGDDIAASAPPNTPVDLNSWVTNDALDCSSAIPKQELQPRVVPVAIPARAAIASTSMPRTYAASGPSRYAGPSFGSSSSSLTRVTPAPNSQAPRQMRRCSVSSQEAFHLNCSRVVSAGGGF